MQIGRKVYYEKSTGNILVDTGERSGDVIETTEQQDFAAYVALADRVSSTVGCLQLEYGQNAQDFATCNGYRVDVSGESLELVFSYPDPSDPEALPTYQKPLSQEIEELKQLVADLASLQSGV